MGRSRSRNGVTEYRALIVVSAVLGYACAFLLLHPFLDPGTTTLSVLPVVVVAWYFGFRAGVLAGLLTTGLTIGLLGLSAPPNLSTLIQRGIPGTIMLIVIGGTIGWTRDLQRRLYAEIAERQRAESELRALVDSAPVGIALSDRAGIVLEANAAIGRILGYSPEELRGKMIGSFAHPGDAPTPQQMREHAEVLAGRRPFFQREKRYFARDGREIQVRLTVAPVRGADGAVRHLTGIVEDITEQKRAAAALRASEERLRTVVDNAPILLFSLDAAGIFILAEGNGFALFADQLPTLVGRHYEEAYAEFPDVIAQTRRALAGEAATTILALGALVFEIALVPLRDGAGTPDGVIGVTTNITERAAYEERLNHQAHHDPLTALPNRLLFSRRLETALAERGPGQAAPAVLFLDLDRFKIINDSLGHDVGDQLLRAVAARLLSCVRPQDTVARLGGDEFTILLAGVLDEREATRVAERITSALAKPFRIDGHEVVVTTSIGIVLATADVEKECAEDLLRYADMAMYRAKSAGKARHTLFDRAMSTEALARLELETELRHALERGEFSLAYQPQIDLATGAIVGVEALIRWQHPTRGTIAPGQFLPLAEETGLIVPLGRWIVATACQQMREWQRWLATWDDPLLPPLSLYVNLSARQFEDPQLIADIAAILDETGLAPSSLYLEMVETVVMTWEPTTRDTLHQLRALGVRLAIDDFGAGSSSLRYLKQFPIETLKIDRAFVAGLGQGAMDDAIIGAIVTLGHGCGARICAEGVETAEQAAHLRGLGCDIGQGYFFSPPVAAAALGELLMEREGLAPARQHGDILPPTELPPLDPPLALPAD